jgi:hypothetical protein
LRVEFTEIKDIRIKCANCKAEITIPIERGIPEHLECPGCNKHLWGDGHQAKAYGCTRNLATVIKDWQALAHGDFSLSFSLPQPSESK